MVDILWDDPAGMGRQEIDQYTIPEDRLPILV
jgi:hypothetical protein